MAVKKSQYQIEFAIKPHAIQQEIVDYINGVHLNTRGHRYRFFVVVCGRQWGKSFIAKYTLMQKAINENKRCMWVAPSIPTARGHWQELCDLIIKSKIPIKRLSQSSKEIHFYGGGSISVRSALEPDNLRGATLDFLVLDEAAYFRDGDYVWSNVLQPMVTASGGSVLFVTTPHGKNWVYHVWKKGQDPDNLYYKSWQAPSTSSPYQDKDLLEDIRKSIPEYKWKEEYLAEFLSDAGGVFNGVDRASKIDMLYAPIIGHTYVAGVDIGFSGDPTRVTILDKYTREQVYGDSWVELGTIKSIKRLGEILDHWQPEVTMFEKNGSEMFFDIVQAVLSGNTPDEHMIAQMMTEGEHLQTLGEILDMASGLPQSLTYAPKERLVGGHRLRAIHMNNLLKVGCVENLAAAIEWGKISLLNEETDYGKDQVAEMSTYQREVTKSGMSITYNAQDGYHDDTISALYLAYYLIPKNIPTISLTSVNKKLPNAFRSGKRLKAGKRRA